MYQKNNIELCYCDGLSAPKQLFSMYSLITITFALKIQKSL